VNKKLIHDFSTAIRELTLYFFKFRTTHTQREEVIEHHRTYPLPLPSSFLPTSTASSSSFNNTSQLVVELWLLTGLPIQELTRFERLLDEGARQVNKDGDLEALVAAGRATPTVLAELMVAH